MEENYIENKISKNDEFVVYIQRIGDNGEGIAEKDGKIVFVPYALVGEEVLIHVVKVKKNFIVGKLKKIIDASPERINAPCKYFEKCGGCDIQHMDYGSQLEFKKKKIADCLSKFAGISVSDFSVNPSPKQYRYRNKFSFPVREQNGEIKIGMFRKNSHDVIDLEDCLLQSEKTQKIIYLFRKYMQKSKISAFNENTNKGIIKHIVVRESEDSFILTVVVTDKKFNNFDILIDLFKSEFSNFGIYKNVNTLNNNVIFGDEDFHVYGIDQLQKNEFGLNYFINNRSFLQVNDEIKNLIYKKIANLIDGYDTVIDAYSGAGLLSANLAKSAKNVFGIEISKEATQNANFLKKINNLSNLTNINGDCVEVLPEIIETIRGDFAIVVDPPRKGLDLAVAMCFKNVKPEMIVYLSCDPATLARDLKLLLEDYEVHGIWAYDMFPQTANVETLVCLKLKKDIEEINKNKTRLKNCKKTAKIPKNNGKNCEKIKYYDYYDDIKLGSGKHIDW